MADCGTSPYQAIEYRGLFDLQNAQIVRAQIDVMDLVAKTADITLLDDPCDKLSWLPVEDVLFWYHCETSTGTLEDLERGYKAFLVNDIVYILAIPAHGELPAQSFIIGHVDVKGTYPCVTDLLLITLPYYASAALHNQYLIFDIGLGEKLDLVTFSPLDSGSPATPTELPAVYDTAAEDWVDYNFEPAVAATTVPCTLTQIESVNDPVTPVDNNTITEYSGNTSISTSDGDACSGFNLGNEMFDYAWDGEYNYSFYSPFPTIKYGKIVYARTHTGSDPNTYHPDPEVLTYCRFYWRDVHESWSEGFVDTDTPAVVRINDQVLSQTFDIPFYISGGIDWASEYIMVNSTYSVTYTQTEQVAARMDATIIDGPILSKGWNTGAQATFSGTGPGDGGIHNSTLVSQSGGYLVDGYQEALRDMTVWVPTRMVGNDGVYALFGCSLYVVKKDGATMLCNVSETQETGYLFYGWGNAGVAFNTSTGTSVAEITKLAVPYITLFDDTFDLNNPVSIRQCLASADVVRSTSLATAIDELVASALEVVGTDPTAVNDSYYYTKVGPTIQVIKKKRA